MPEPTPADALDRMRRQVRAVRWRRNLHELQGTVYYLLAILAGTATVVVVLALRAEPGVFAAAAWGLAAATLILAAWLVRALVRRWLSPARTPLWIDRRAGLGGRLATALEIAHRGGEPAPFLPFLIDDNGRRLPAWLPERLVPEGMPSGAFATALAAAGTLLLVLLLAPWLPPDVPGGAPADADGGSGALQGRLTLTRAPRSKSAHLPATLAEPDADDRSALSRLPNTLQERIQGRLWGEDRERARQALARAERGPRAERTSPPTDRFTDASDPEERWAILRKRAPAAQPTGSADGAAAAGETAATDASRPQGEGARPDERGGDAGAHQAASGAGTGTDPNLLGAASAERAQRERFDLPLAARVRALGGGPEAPAPGDAPAPAPDARPDLAAQQRRDMPVLRMPVPPAYEAAVRAVFAHHESEVSP